MDTVDRRVFLIDDVTFAKRISIINYSALNIKWSNSKLNRTARFYESVIREEKHKLNSKIYGVNNIYHNLIGFAHYSLSHELATLETIAVMPEYQRMHVGRILLRQSIFDLAIMDDIAVVRADVKDSKGVLSFYKDFGFTNLDKTPIDTEEKEDYGLTKLVYQLNNRNLG